MLKLVDDPIQFSPHVEAIILGIIYVTSTIFIFFAINPLFTIQIEMFQLISQSAFPIVVPQWVEILPVIYLGFGLRNCWLIWHRVEEDKNWNAKEEAEKFRLKGMD